jgi:CTP:molybdopterin cytidylyltransferase MocA
MIPIILLAAGASSRMRGRDKLLEDIDGTPLLRRQAVMARAVSDQVLVALPPHPHPRYDIVADLDVTLIEVAHAAEGLGASLRTAFAALSEDTDKALVLLCDLPEITGDDLRRVIAAVHTHPDALIWRGATQDGKGGHPMIFDRQLFPAFAALTGDNGGQQIVRSAGARVHLIALPGDRARLDLDTPEEWAAWRAQRREV